MHFSFQSSPTPLKLMLLFYISQFTVLDAGLKISNAVVCSSLLPSVSQEGPLSFASSEEFLQEDG